jgi:serine/threonine-protein phosphatase 2A regulatory subunit B
MFLWDIERADRPYIVCDMGRGLRVEDCEEINCCQMHPQQDSIFLYGMSKGSLKLGDLRVASKVESNSLTYRSTSSKQRNILLDAVSSISSATFSKNGKYLVSRDCLTVKIWDVANPNKPLNSIYIH